jgi:hypothetical protein
MEAIYDRNSRVVAWRQSNNIFHINGLHTAVIRGNQVYGHRGQHLGVFKNGLFRDHRGCVVAFMNGASGGPVLPIPSVSPVPPVPAVPSVPPVPAVPSLSWGMNWQEFINA